MAKTEMVGIRITPEIAKWLETFEKSSGKNTSELIRDMLEESYRNYQEQVNVQKKAERSNRLAIERWRKLLTNIGVYLSNSKNIERCLQTIIGFKQTLNAWELHLGWLAGELTGQKVTRKRRDKKRMKRNKDIKETRSEPKLNKDETI